MTLNKVSLIILVGTLFISLSTFVASHDDIKTFVDLFKVQIFFGWFGGWAAVIVQAFTKGLLQKDAPADKTVN